MKTNHPIRALVLALLLGACGTDATRIELTVSADPAWSLDGYQLAIGARAAASDVVPKVVLQLADDEAGTPLVVQVWGTVDGAQVAYGSVTVTPALHETVAATIVLDELSCGLWCELGAVACEDDGIVECTQLANGCRAWSDPAPCDAATPFCSNGTCDTVCVDECDDEATSCSGGLAVRLCGEHDSDDCADWSMPIACDDGDMCLDGACEGATPCVEDGDACDDHDDCTSDDTCSDGVCGGEPACALTWLAIEAGGNETCALLPDRTVQCWGTDFATPPSGKFDQISVGTYHACGLRRDGDVVCWGSCTFGECDPPAGEFQAIETGRFFTCGIHTDDTIECWGRDTADQIDPPDDEVRELALGGEFGCATNGSDVTCWGSDTDGQSSPPGFGGYARLAAGDYHACGLNLNGEPTCWGGNLEGQSDPPDERFDRISCGERFCCGVLLDGALSCWGDDSDGQASPPAGDFIEIAAGSYHACALRDDGTAACWGSCGGGQCAVPGP